MNSSSSPNVSMTKASPGGTSPKSKQTVKLPPIKSSSATKVSERGDAGWGIYEIRRKDSALTRPQPTSVRRQRSAPTLGDSAKSQTGGGSGSAREKEESKESTVAPQLPLKTEDHSEPCNAKASSSIESTDSSKPVCEGLVKDPKLKALCVSLGINQSPDTLIGPIEKGQLIIGILQDTLDELIKFKVKSAERKGFKFHIQRSGLDMAQRALENAERSLKTIKESKRPVLGRARYQQSAESIPQEQQKVNEAVIRILTTTKQKFEKMGKGIDKLMRTVSFVSFVSSSTSQSSKYGTALMRTPASSSTALPNTSVPNSKRTTAISYLTTTVPATPINTAPYSRARTSTSAISVGSRSVNKANPIPVA